MEENNSEKFRRIAEKRVSDATNKIRLISKLSDPKAFSYTQEEIDDIFSHLAAELEACKQAFKNSSEPAVFQFSKKKDVPSSPDQSVEAETAPEPVVEIPVTP